MPAVPPLPAPSETVAQALEDLEDPQLTAAEADTAWATAREELDGWMSELTRRLVHALDELHPQSTPEAHRVFIDHLEQTPTLAYCFEGAQELATMLLGLDPDGPTSARLRALGREMGSQLEPDLQDLTNKIGQELQRSTAAAHDLELLARLRPEQALTLRRFRARVAWVGGPDFRARALAFEFPDRLDLAHQLLRQDPDPGHAATVFAAASGTEQRLAPGVDPNQVRPKRRFTIVHFVAFLLLSAISAYHYFLR